LASWRSTARSFNSYSFGSCNERAQLVTRRGVKRGRRCEEAEDSYVPVEDRRREKTRRLESLQIVDGKRKREERERERERGKVGPGRGEVHADA
jgi:hypothetical protein